MLHAVSHSRTQLTKALPLQLMASRTFLGVDTQSAVSERGGIEKHVGNFME